MKRLITFPLIVLIGLAGMFFFFFYFGTHDSKALTEFSTAYQNYDRAFSGFSTAVFASNVQSTTAISELAQNADQRLVELDRRASARISSLTRHDAEIMTTTQEIADLSGKELEALKAYRNALVDHEADLEQLAGELDELTIKRQAAYARFQDFGGQ